jgi:hypothetical protein
MGGLSAGREVAIGPAEGVPSGGSEGGPGGRGLGRVGGLGVRGGVPGGGGSRGPGAGVGGVAADQAPGRSGLGARGGGAGVGGMPLAGGPARSSEDEERERPSYLVENDPNELFGTDEATIPPVIE